MEGAFAAPEVQEDHALRGSSSSLSTFAHEILVILWLGSIRWRRCCCTAQLPVQNWDPWHRTSREGSQHDHEILPSLHLVPCHSVYASLMRNEAA